MIDAPGISLVTSYGSPAELAEAAGLAERAGFASVWATEFYDRSATIALAAMAHATRTIELGSAIAYAFGRTPLVLAAETRDLDELSGGRITLGLGTGTRRMQQDWHVPIPQAIARSTAIWHSRPRQAAISATRFIIGSGPQV